MSNFDWMTSPTFIVASAILTVLALDQLVWSGDKYAAMIGIDTDNIECLSYAGNPVEAGDEQQDPERAKTFSKRDARYQQRDKLFRYLAQCETSTCPADVLGAVQKEAWTYFDYRSKAVLEDYRRFGEPALETLRWRYGTVDDNQIVSKLRGLYEAQQIQFTNWSYSTRVAAKILMSGRSLEPCRMPKNGSDS